jgi:hypothetical protein
MVHESRSKKEQTSRNIIAKSSLLRYLTDVTHYLPRYRQQVDQKEAYLGSLVCNEVKVKKLLLESVDKRQLLQASNPS